MLDILLVLSSSKVPLQESTATGEEVNLHLYWIGGSVLTHLMQGMIERTDLENRQSSGTSVKNIHRLGIEKKILSQALLIIIKHTAKNVTFF